MRGKITPFDHDLFFKEEIAPLLKQIRSLCEENLIPFYWEFAVKNGTAKTKYEVDMLSPRPMGHVLHTNTILHHVLVSLGYRCVAPEDVEEMEMEAVMPELPLGRDAMDATDDIIGADFFKD